MWTNPGSAATPDAGQPPHLRATRLLDNDVATAPKLQDEHAAHPSKDHELSKTTQAKTISEARETRDIDVLPGRLIFALRRAKNSRRLGTMEKAVDVATMRRAQEILTPSVPHPDSLETQSSNDSGDSALASPELHELHVVNVLRTRPVTAEQSPSIKQALRTVEVTASARARLPPTDEMVADEVPHRLS